MAIPMGVGTRVALGVAKRGKQAATASKRFIRKHPVGSTTGAFMAGDVVGSMSKQEAQHPYPRGY